MRQYLSVKERYPDAIVFYRLGDFYEMFFDDALVAARELDLTLTARNRGKDDEAPMCGVPAVSHEGYIAKLIRKGYRVAICEQLGDPRDGKGLVERDVVRVVTPGTFVQEDPEDRAATRFLMAFYPRGGLAGCAFLDAATGAFELFEIPLHGDRSSLPDLVARYDPREILVPDGPEATTEDAFATGDLPEPRPTFTRVPAGSYQPFEAHRMIKETFGDAAVESLGLSTRPLALAAAGAALGYVARTQRAVLAHVCPPRIVPERDLLALDGATLRNLEILKGTGGGREGSLVAIVDETLTAMGSRLLRSWLARPLCDPQAIGERQDAVEALRSKPADRARLRSALERVRDLERLTGRIALKVATPRDLMALAASLLPLPDIAATVATVPGSKLLAALARDLDPLADVRAQIVARLADDPPASHSDGGLVRSGFSTEIDELRALAHDAKSALVGIEARERERTGIGNLKVRYNKVFGYYIEVSKGQLANVPAHYDRKQTLVGAERFITPELKEHEDRALHAADRLVELEHALFVELRDAIAEQAGRIQETAARVARIDLLQGFGEIAEKRRYVRPVVSASDRIHIVDGRHPVVEAAVGFRSFIANDTDLDNSTRQILIVTGPNMGGKSTYLRQVALITLLAQTGCYVPAREAEIGVVDRIFTRIGASDDLARGRSTFLVEMSETAHIVAHATARSLVILDEIGRGTSTFDGLSIAWAVAEHLHDNPRVAAKTLFATHYHELTDLAMTCGRVKNVQIAVREWNDQIVFLRKIIEGASDKSYGISVAKLAGLPRAVIDRAREILSNLAQGELDERGMPRLAGGGRSQARSDGPVQPSLFPAPLHPILEELGAIDTASLTPLEALRILDAWQRRLRS